MMTLWTMTGAGSSTCNQSQFVPPECQYVVKSESKEEGMWKLGQARKYSWIGKTVIKYSSWVLCAYCLRRSQQRLLWELQKVISIRWKFLIQRLYLTFAKDPRWTGFNCSRISRTVAPTIHRGRIWTCPVPGFHTHPTGCRTVRKWRPICPDPIDCKI